MLHDLQHALLSNTNEAGTIETRHLRIFTSVYKSRSFTKAADILHTSQPTVSEHIRNLESRLNCKLFDRLGRTIMPTKEAEILYPRALAILEDLQKLEDELAMAGKSVTGELILGASTIPGAYILPSIASSFKNTYPGISFEIRIDDSTKIIEAIQSNDIFIGIVGAQIPARKITYQQFAEDELILICSGKSDLPDQISPVDIAALPFIHREHGSGTRKNIEAFLSQKEIGINQLNVIATLGSSTAVKEAVKADLGVSIISRYAVQDELITGSVRQVAIEGLIMSRMLYIASASKRTLPHHYQVFLNSILHQSEE